MSIVIVRRDTHHKYCSSRNFSNSHSRTHPQLENLWKSLCKFWENDARNSGKPLGHKRLRIAISIVGVVFASVHIIWPTVKVDEITVALTVLSLLPWLQPIFKSVDLPGLGKVEMQDREQGSADAPSASDSKPTPTPNPQDSPFTAEPASGQSPPLHDSDARRKVLATLWRYQQQLFSNEPEKRWTFAVSPTASDFAFYLRGVAQLVSEGVVIVLPQNHQCTLTNEGFIYCKQHPEELSGDIYQF